MRNKRIDAYLTRTLSGSVFTWREIFRLMIPGILDNLSITLISMLTTALISKNGETSIAAVALVGPVTGLMVCFFTGISAGASVIVAQCWGGRDEERLKRAISTGFFLTVLVGMVISAPLLLFPEGILKLLYADADPLVLEKARIYLSGSVWSILIFTVYTAGFAILRGLGESKRCLVLSIVINLAYFLFSVLFLNVLDMDIQGSVWALILARFVGTALTVILLLYWKPPVKMSFFRLFRFDRELLGRTMRVSLPFGLEQICISVGNLTSKMYMVPLGTSAISTHTIANSVLTVFTTASLSAGNLAVTVVGKCIGAGKKEEAYTYGKRCNQLATVLMVLSCLVFVPLLPVLLNRFHPTAEAYAMAKQLLLYSIPSLILFAPMSNTLPFTLRAGGDSAYPSIVSLAVLWVISIALGYALAIPAGLGLWGIWIAQWLSWAVRSLFFDLRFRRKHWLDRA
ncbi:MAG: MATE family efflux transporter [Oscillospiraceae bacterium]|nr:MATE family efflux transporter [Oscillospiraceae bacterium]